MLLKIHVKSDIKYTLYRVAQPITGHFNIPEFKPAESKQVATINKYAEVGSFDLALQFSG